jgi:hypothetical protein
MPMKFERDDWPLIRIVWPEGALTDSDLDQFMSGSMADLAKRNVHCILHISHSTVGMSAPQRKQFADLLERTEPQVRQWTAGVAIVTPSAIIRGMITAINWMKGTPCPQRTFSSEPEARLWLADVYETKTATKAPFQTSALSKAV